jgi:transketolase N-terminal domain/subunit
MVEKNQPVNFEELILANTISISALTNVLEKKGLLKHEEVLAEVERLKKELNEHVKKN